MPDTVKKLSRVEDHLGNEVRNFTIEQVAGDPSSPNNGRPWIDTSLTPWAIKVRLNGTTQIIARLSGILDADIAAGAAIALSKLATNPLARSGHTGTQVASTISDLAAVVKAYRLDEFAAPTAAVALGAQRITGLANASAGTDAMNRDTVRAQTLNQLAAPTTDLAVNGQKITGMADGVAATDAATVQQVAAAQGGLDPKDSVRFVSTSNITLSGLQEIDGATVIATDRVLVVGQSTAADNGIYAAAVGAWTRTSDANASAEVTSGLYVWVTEGVTYADTGWVLTTDGVIVLGVTALVFAQFSGLGQITAGSALTKTGNTLDVAVDGSTVEVSSDALRVKAGGITESHLADDSVDLDDSQGTITGTLALGNGGTGATTAAAARTALGVGGRYLGTVTGDGAATVFNVNHALNNDLAIGLSCFERTTKDEWDVGVHIVDANNAEVTIAPAPANLKVFDVLVIG